VPRKRLAFRHAIPDLQASSSLSTMRGIAGLEEPQGEIRVYDDAGENVVEVIPVQGQRAFGV